MLVVQNATMSIVYTYLVRISYVHLMYLRKTKNAPTVGLEPTTLRFKVSCSTDWASRAAALGTKEYGSIRLWAVLNQGTDGTDGGNGAKICISELVQLLISQVDFWLHLKRIFLYYRHWISFTKGAYHKYTRYRFTLEPRKHTKRWRFYRDLNSDRWIQSPEC